MILFVNKIQAITFVLSSVEGNVLKLNVRTRNVKQTMRKNE